jgi:hypothetical protein
MITVLQSIAPLSAAFPLWVTACATLTGGEKCTAEKLMQAGHYGECRSKAVVEGIKAGEAPDYFGL